MISTIRYCWFYRNWVHTTSLACANSRFFSSLRESFFTSLRLSGRPTAFVGSFLFFLSLILVFSSSECTIPVSFSKLSTLSAFFLCLFLLPLVARALVCWQLRRYGAPYRSHPSLLYFAREFRKVLTKLLIIQVTLSGDINSHSDHPYITKSLSLIYGNDGFSCRAIKVWDFEFGPCSIGYDFLDGWLDTLTPFRFTATKFIDGIPVHLEIIASLKGTRWIFALGFLFDGESFGAAMGKISGRTLPDGGFFDSVGVSVEVRHHQFYNRILKIYTDLQTNYAF